MEFRDCPLLHVVRGLLRAMPYRPVSVHGNHPKLAPMPEDAFMFASDRFSHRPEWLSSLRVVPQHSSALFAVRINAEDGDTVTPRSIVTSIKQHLDTKDACPTQKSILHHKLAALATACAYTGFRLRDSDWLRATLTVCVAYAKMAGGNGAELCVHVCWVYLVGSQCDTTDLVERVATIQDLLFVPVSSILPFAKEAWNGATLADNLSHLWERRLANVLRVDSKPYTLWAAVCAARLLDVFKYSSLIL